ncbi:MAG TPA: helix-turn-helix domain-containing protein [Acidobacteriaceae bacterium]|nr:helix-turn-helix domain-containing protein [Acidobacteriaceae bacterium]
MVSSTFVPVHKAEHIFHERFVDADEAAIVLGVHPKTLQRWSRQGVVPAHPIGEGRRKYWRYLISELEAWLRDRTVQTPRNSV